MSDAISPGRKRTRQLRDDLDALPTTTPTAAVPSESRERSDSMSDKLSKSCDLCKLKKVRCDGVKPMCSFCTKNGMDTCTYSYVKKPGLKPGYGKGMSQRMDYLENELLKLREEMAVIRGSTRQRNSPSAQVPSPLNPNTGVAPAPLPLPSSKDPAPRQHIEIPNLLNPDQGHRFSLPSASHCLLLIELFFSRIAPIFPLLHPSMATDLNERVRLMSQGQEPPLILYAVVLISLKFLNTDQMTKEQKRAVYLQCKDIIISRALKKVNLESLQAMILLAYDALSGRVKVPEAWNYVSIAADYATYLKLGTERAIRVSMVAGDSPDSQHSGHSNGTSDIARRKSKSIANRSLNLLRRPKDWVDEESRRHCFWCIYILDKIFAISSSHEMKLKSGKITSLLPLKLSLWNSSGASLQGMFQPSQQQVRTLRSVESTPKHTGVSSETPQTITPHDNNLSLSQQLSSDSYDSFAYYIELSKIVGDIHTFLIEEFNIYSSNEVMTWRMRFKTLETQLYAWVSSLPSQYRQFLETGSFPHVSNAGSPGSSGYTLAPYDCLLFVYYYTSLIKLHSSFGYPHGESEHFKASEDSKAQCLDSVTKVFHFVRSLPSVTDDPIIFERLGPHFGFFIWVNSRILFVNVIYQSTNRSLDQAKLALYQNILVMFSDVLYKIGQYWESSMVYYKILHFLNVSDLSYVNRFNRVSQKASNEDESTSDDEDITDETREPAQVFSDMRMGSHSLLFWFNKLASKGSVTQSPTTQMTPAQTPAGSGMRSNIAGENSMTNLNMARATHSLFENSESLGQALSNFQTSSALPFDEFQLTHDDFFNFLAMDINGSGSFQDMRYE